MPRRAPTGGRFAQPCVDPALPLCDLNSLWTHAYEKLMAENRRLIAANSSEPGTYLDYSNFLMASNVADNVLRRRDRALGLATRGRRIISTDDRIVIRQISDTHRRGVRCRTSRRCRS